MPEYAPFSITTSTTTLVCTGKGILHTLIVNKPVATKKIQIYDGIDATGTLLATITYGAALLSDPPDPAVYDMGFNVGLCIVTDGAHDITGSYRTR